MTDTCWGPRYGYCGHTRQCVQHASISEKWGAQNQASLIEKWGPERDTDPLSLIHSQFVYELVMVRNGVFSLSDQSFTNADILVAIELLCTN